MTLLNSPIALFLVSLLGLSACAQVGDTLRTRVRPLREEDRDDFSTVLGATLTLLGLLIGFTFSMAINRYDLRKNYEEGEANAIGTEYIRADLLPESDAAKIRELLKRYIDQRVLFYSTRDPGQLSKIDADTSALQNELWAAVQPAAKAQPTSVTALAISGMNDVLNSQSYAQAAWWNRIPAAAWVLMAAIAVCCNLMIGYRSHRKDWRIFLVTPFAVSIAFLLIADIDSPWGGMIRVSPQNLISLSQSLRGR